MSHSDINRKCIRENVVPFYTKCSRQKRHCCTSDRNKRPYEFCSECGCGRPQGEKGNQGPMRTKSDKGEAGEFLSILCGRTSRHNAPPCENGGEHCSQRVGVRDGKEHEPSKNVQNQNTDSVKNRIEPEHKCHGSVLSLNEIVGMFTHFTVNEEFYLT